MELSRNQDLALKAVSNWFNNSSEQVFHLFGYAGTGKTTLARYFAENLETDVLFGAYTGKAAYVLRTKGCANAATIHSMIYRSRDKSRADLIRLELELEELIRSFIEMEIPESEFKLRNSYTELVAQIAKEKQASDQPIFKLNTESPVKDAGLLIIDECSMVDNQMGSDLLSFGTPVLVLGDPAQLPPIMSGGYFTENVQPDIMLTEIHRQAGDNPIIRMATETREKKALQIGAYGESHVYPTGTKLDAERIMAFDQILVGKNKTRFATNSKMRRLQGFNDPYPVPDDKLVCLRNNSEMGLLNGQIFSVISSDGVLDGDVFMTVASEDTGAQIEVQAHEEHFLVGHGDDIKWFEKKEAEEFDFGYALTVHKSQGSQWKDVCVFDESYVFRKDRWRWLYTAITRAADTVTVIKM